MPVPPPLPMGDRDLRYGRATVRRHRPRPQSCVLELRPGARTWEIRGMTLSQETKQPLIKVENLQKLFPVGRGLFRKATQFIHAVDGISFEIAPGESLALVGESGSGKTTTGRILARLEVPTGGDILLKDGEEMLNVSDIDRAGMKRFRRRVQMIFQDPDESMNPRRTIFDTIAEPLQVQGIGRLPEREQRVSELLDMVG